MRSMACVCLSDGAKNFSPMTIEKSGFFVPGDAKGVATLHTAKNEDVLIATQNQGPLRVFAPGSTNRPGATTWIALKTGDFTAEMVLTNGQKRRVEFYYGSTFLSQSSRWLAIGKDVKQVTITDFRGTKRNAL